MMIAHPPCTYLCNSGSRWLHEQSDRWNKLQEATDFFYHLWMAPIEKICIENPVPHYHANLPEYTQLIQPWMFGHEEKKGTCLWLKNLPKLVPTKIMDIRKPRVHMESPGPDRWKRRSITYQGIAAAMAEQWS